MEFWHVACVEPSDERARIEAFSETLKFICCDESIQLVRERADDSQARGRQLLRLIDGKNGEYGMNPPRDLGTLQELAATVADLIELLHVGEFAEAALPSANDMIGKGVDCHASHAPASLRGQIGRAHV